MCRTELNHPLDTHIHHVPQSFLRNYSVLVWTCWVMRSASSLSRCIFCYKSFVLQVENIHLSHVHFLILYIGSYNYSKKWHVILFEALLEHWVGLKVHIWRIYSEDRVTVIPCEDFDSVPVTLFHDSNLLNIADFAILPSVAEWSTWLCRVNTTNDDIFDSFLGAIDRNIGIINMAAKHSNDFMLGKIGMHKHKHLDFKCKVNTIRLLIPADELLAWH